MPEQFRAVKTVQSGDRMIAILDFMALAPGAVSIKEIGDSLGLAASTVHRLLATLVGGGLVERRHDRRYHLGAKLIALGHAAQAQLDLRSVALDAMRALARKTQLEVNLARLVDGDILYIEKVVEDAPFSLNIQVGQRRPAFCRALGKVLLAYLGTDEILRRVGPRLPRFTDRTITDPDELLAHLAEVRKHGYAVDREEAQVGCICMAAPIRDVSGHVVAAVSVSGPTSQMLVLEQTDLHLPTEVKQTADAISSKLGLISMSS